jgi:radical SAM superfamily enzyme YgiQ (UPF0313 family)
MFLSFFSNRIQATSDVTRGRNNGVRFVLTSSAAEMATFDNSWMKAMMCSFPEALVVPFVKKYMKPQNMSDGTARFAPYGLRKIESLLVEEYGEESVVVVHPSNLDKFVGTNTEAVLISTMDPLGLAYVSMTYNPLIGFGGESVNRREFIKLLNHDALRKYKHVKKIVGGFGVWQVNDSGLQDKLGIDCLMAGECEEWLIPMLKKIEKGEPLPKYFRTTKLRNYEKVPLIRHAAGFGAVEITRGCGRRCQFCSPDYRTKYDFPLEHIMKEIEVNVRNGCNAAFLVTEDIFLYGNDSRFNPNPKKLRELLGSIAGHPYIHQIAFSHASLVPVLVDRNLLGEITPLIIEKSHYAKRGRKFVGVDIGIESGSVRIMRKYMNGKAYPYSIEAWPNIVVEGTGLLNDNQWFPMYTFILGLPEEREDDVLATLELLDRLNGCTVFYVPLLFVPLEEAILRNARRASLEKMNDLHWEFLMDCWNRNLKTWAEDINPLVKVSAFIAYPYLRHVHGPKSFRSVMRFIGLPYTQQIRNVAWKRCESDYCIPKGNRIEVTSLNCVA